MNVVDTLLALPTILHRRLTQGFRLPCPVISVGNISVGGRAKTPLVIEFARALRTEGYFPVVLTRGYGRHSTEALTVDGEGILDANRVGDEPLEIFYRSGATVLVGAQRKTNALKWLASLEVSTPPGLTSRRSEHRKNVVFILDDGFQHWALARNFDVASVRAEDRLDHLIPWGRLREPAGALTRAHAILELGRDFTKKSILRRPPDPARPSLLVSSRAPDPAYAREFSAFKISTLELADHASAEELLRGIEASNYDQVIVGAKEAVKLFAAADIQAFFERGQGSLALPSGPKSFHYAECVLEWRSSFSELLAQMLEAIR